MKAIVIGKGFIAETHINSIRKVGAEVACVVGRDEAKTREFALEHDIERWVTGLEEALASDAEIVHICTPPHTHAGIIRACLAAGKHIICEKPLCIDPDEAKALAEEAEQAYNERGLITALCCNVRFYPANLSLAEKIRGEGRDCKVISGSYLQEFHIPPHPDGWRFDDELSGGMRAITEIGTHWIDLAYALTGVRISEVFAETRNWLPTRYRKDGMLTADESGAPVSISSEDTAAVLFRLENGGIGNLLLSETSPGHPNDLTIEISDLDRSYYWEERKPEWLHYSSDGRMMRKMCPVDDRSDSFTALFREVYAAATGRSHLRYPDFEDGAYIAAVCSAIKQSSETHSWVSVK